MLNLKISEKNAFVYLMIVVFAVFTPLKLLSIISWSWWTVCLPLLIPLSLLAFCITSSLFFSFSTGLIDTIEDFVSGIRRKRFRRQAILEEASDKDTHQEPQK